MKSNNNILCVIQARGGSKGIPKKNIFPINGHPLISYTIEAAKNSKFIEQIFVSTDSKEIASIAKEYGAKVPFYRSKKSAGDNISSYSSLIEFVTKIEKFNKKKYDFIIELPCVAPFRTSFYIDKAIKKILSKKFDSVISYVDTGEKNPVRLKKINGNKVINFCKDYPENELTSFRQSFEKSYIRNGAIYLMTRSCLFKKNSRIGKKQFPLIMPQNISINIDEKFDLLLAKLLIESGYCENRPKKIKKISNEKFSKNNKKKLLVSAPFDFINKEKNLLIKKYNCVFAYQNDKEFIKDNIHLIEGWICSPSPNYFIGEQILKKAKKLKVIVTPSTGSNHIDINFCEKKNIKVHTIKNSLEFKKIKASSEFTFGLMINLVKNIEKSFKVVRSGSWRDREEELRSIELESKKIGIIGFGRIGQNLSNYSKSFNMKVYCYDPFKKIQDNKVKQFKNIINLLKTVDIVFCCVNLLKSNRNFFSEKLFKYMKKGSYFINTSRGEVVVEKDLIKYLEKGIIKAAAVDVVREEHKLNYKKNKLIEYAKKNSNLLISPHIAGLTYESEKKAANISIKLLEKELN